MPTPAGQSYRDIEYRRVGDHILHLDAFVPAAAGLLPAAVIVHGGAWVAGDRIRNVGPLFDPLANAGFAWFSISYTLANDISRFGAAVHDVTDAIQYVMAHSAQFNVDPARIFLIGESAGAQLATLTSLRNPGLPVRAVVAFYMPSDLEELAHSARNIHSAAASLLGSPLESLMLPRLRALSPIHSLRSGMPPLLLIHGTDDPLVPYNQSVAMCRAVRTAGGACDLIAVRGAGHGLQRWESTGTTSYKRLMIDWLRAH
jgi:acetyl esterase/lipase